MKGSRKMIILIMILILLSTNALCNDALVVDEQGHVGIGTANPNATLDVNGKIRGKAVYAFDSLTMKKSVSSNVIAFVDDLSISLDVQHNDLVMVILSASLRNEQSETTYMRIALKSGSAESVLTPNHILVNNPGWAGGSSIGIYRATGDGNVSFTAEWKTAAGTAQCHHLNIVAYVIGK